MSKSNEVEGEDEDGDEDEDEVEDGELSAPIYKWVDSQIFWGIIHETEQTDPYQNLENTLPITKEQTKRGERICKFKPVCFMAT